MPKDYKAVIISADKDLVARITGFLFTKNVSWLIYEKGSDAMEGVLDSLPAIIIVSMNLPDMSGAEIVETLKSENVYSQVPILLCVNSDEFDTMPDFNALMVDDFFVLPGDEEELKKRILLTIVRALRNLDANPLSRLPGNTSIIRHVQDRIDKKDDFAMCYCDLDFFKSFNDKYGFTRGDEILLMAARIILNTARSVSPDDFFVGHIGGDDFVFVVPSEKAEEACQKIIASFDAIVPHFYDMDDLKRGGIVSTDRKGEICNFPLMTISIAVVKNTNARLSHVGEASAISMNLKKKAKQSLTSAYVIDQRKI